MTTGGVNTSMPCWRRSGSAMQYEPRSGEDREGTFISLPPQTSRSSPLRGSTSFSLLAAWRFMMAVGSELIMRVLVTGATGRVGSRLVPHLLRRGDAVRILAREPERVDALRQQGA